MNERLAHQLPKLHSHRTRLCRIGSGASAMAGVMERINGTTQVWRRLGSHHSHLCVGLSGDKPCFSAERYCVSMLRGSNSIYRAIIP